MVDDEMERAKFKLMLEPLLKILFTLVNSFHLQVQLIAYSYKESGKSP